MTEQYNTMAVIDRGVLWRIFELETCQKHLGLTVDVRPEDVTAEKIILSGVKYVVWKLATEATTEPLWQHTVAAASCLGSIRQINDPRGWLACHAKEVAFKVWREQGVPCPNWFEFECWEDFTHKDNIGYPLLMRLNNGTGGQCSFLVQDREEAQRHGWPMLCGVKDHKYGPGNQGTRRKFIAVQFIPATLDDKVNMSFRIIVAGNKVTAGYARISPKTDWLAITNRFEPWMQPLFIGAQKRCRAFCQENEALIVKSVKCLGLNFQGVDVILDQEGKPYFLEVQPGFSVGYANNKSWLPPFYNPSRPETLVNYLVEKEAGLRRHMPWYYERWLDKYAMFDASFKALKEDL